MSEAKQTKQVKARLSTLYEYDFQMGTIKLKNRKCPRCGNVMAFHKSAPERWTCGSCSFTDFAKTKK